MSLCLWFLNRHHAGIIQDFCGCNRLFVYQAWGRHSLSHARCIFLLHHLVLLELCLLLFKRKIGHYFRKVQLRHGHVVRSLALTPLENGRDIRWGVLTGFSLLLFDEVLKCLHFHLFLCKFLLIFLFSLVELLIYFLRFKETFWGKLLYLLLLLCKFSLQIFPSLPLLFISLLVFEYLALTLVYNLQEEVLHQAHRLLIFLSLLDLYKIIIAGTHTFELLFKSFWIFQNVFYLW